ncbi:MAG TPA: LytTR family transcriptional regulator DNA-binding domain-containing protein [Candidatus Avamphibacillus intestinigallinarum]|nr:LytTR family transcriptional regulator DNA-binding domain-containing protein [Candidatus Avamphibacillus intestinigallinarum]
MHTYTFKHVENEHNILPTFSLALQPTTVTTLYSNPDLQNALFHCLLKEKEMTVFDGKDGLYERLSVEANIKFFHNWLNCSLPLAEILVMFALHNCAHKNIKDCNHSEIQRVLYAKYFMMAPKHITFLEPVHRVDIVTVNVFMMLLGKFTEQNIQTLVLISNLEHALLLGDETIKLQNDGLHPLIVEDQENHNNHTATLVDNSPKTTDLFKVSAKMQDKVVFFDPTEIDYIESQEGKSHIVVNEEYFSLNASLTEIEKKLEMYGFFRCHRSYIVNLQKVREIITWSKNTYSIRINNKTHSTIPLSRSKVQAIQAMFDLS